MFEAFLKAHPLLPMLEERPFIFAPPAQDRAAWAGVSPAAREEIGRQAARYAAQPYPMRRASDFLQFARTGSRAADEGPYFFRRRKLCWAVLNACLHEDAPLDDVVDGLWCVMEETSWVISAHNVNPVPGAPAAAEYPLPDETAPYIDLFAAQTGMILSLSAALLGPRLDAVSPVLRARVEREVGRRILTPFMTHDEFWWMGFRRKDLCNWTPWIVSNVMLCACLRGMAREDLARLLTRACGMLDRWLDVVPDDGGCDEGAGYWNMAGGALLDCLELLETLTGGRMTFWQEPKVRNILMFPVRAALEGGWFVNFADCDARPLLSGERLQLAGERLGDAALVGLGVRERGTLSAQLDDVPHFGRLLRMLFHPTAGSADFVPRGDVWLPDLQLRVVRRGAWTLCAKGGHNGESHNHNDVGSLMLYADAEPALVDAGNMVYTGKTFSSERYTLWNVRSAYHNVPLVGGEEQRAGTQYAARDVRCLPDGLSLDIAGAYPAGAGVCSLARGMRLTPEGLTLTDHALLSREAPMTWVFMLRQPPRPVPGGLVSGRVRMAWPAPLRYAAEEIPVTDSRMARNFPGSLWRVCLTSAPALEHQAIFTFGRADSDA